MLHEDRGKNIGSSEVACLFGAGFESYYSLYMRKTGALTAPFFENDRMFWGTWLEAAIAAGFRELTGWNVRRVHRYVKHKTVRGFAASLDCEVIAHEDGPGVLEIKNVDRSAYMDWPEPRRPDLMMMEEIDGARTWRSPDREPPLSYMLQLMHQLACTGRSWGVVAVLVGGNDIRPFRFRRHEGTIAKLELAVEEFWGRADRDDPPPIDWDTDAATVLALQNSVTENTQISLQDDSQANDLARKYLSSVRLEGMAKRIKETSKARLVLKMGDAERAILDDRMSITRGKSGIRIHKKRRSRR